MITPSFVLRKIQSLKNTIRKKAQFKFKIKSNLKGLES